MPFVSKSQEQWAFSTGQPFAKKWAGMTNQKSLPKKVHQKTYSKGAVKAAMVMGGHK